MVNNVENGLDDIGDLGNLGDLGDLSNLGLNLLGKFRNLGNFGNLGNYGNVVLAGCAVVAGSAMFIGLPSLSGLARKGVTNAFLLYARSRSKYRWTVRCKTPGFMRHLGDYVFQLDKNAASIDSPRNLAESIKVMNATFRKNNMCLEVTDKLNSCLRGMTESGNIILQLSELVKVVPGGMLGYEECSLEVLYLGHADPSKKIPAAEFGVKYNAKVCSSIVFPPYKVSEKIKKGLATNKVVHARTFHEKNLTHLATRYAGLRANFYRDVDDPTVQKDHIDHKEVHVLLSEKGKAPYTVVVTRK